MEGGGVETSEPSPTSDRQRAEEENVGVGVPWSLVDCTRSHRANVPMGEEVTQRKSFMEVLPEEDLEHGGERVSRGHPSQTKAGAGQANWGERIS